MAAKKDYRSDNTYMISTDTGDNPKTRCKGFIRWKRKPFLRLLFWIYKNNK